MVKSKKHYIKQIKKQKIIIELKKKNYEQKFELKGKIINHQINNGNKRTSEKTLLQCVKSFQKTSLKNYKKIIQLAVINTTPVFLLKDIKKLKKRRKNKIVIPFIPKKNLRISYSIKNIILEALKKKSFEIKNSYKSLSQEILLSAYKKSATVKKKNDSQEQALKRKKQLARFRWF